MGYLDYALIKKSTLGDIGDAIRKRTGDPSLIDPVDFAKEIEKVNILQEKYVTKNGTVVVPDEGYNGLSKVLVDIPMNVGLSNGYTVNFYDYDKNLIETHGAKCGAQIDKPISYEAETWQNISGIPITFPFTVDAGNEGTVVNLYAGGTVTCAHYLYSFYGIDVGEYPYVFICGWNSDNLARLYFAKTAYHYYDNGYVLDLSNALMSSETVSIYGFDNQDSVQLVDIITNLISAKNFRNVTTKLSPAGSGYTYHPTFNLWYNKLPEGFNNPPQANIHSLNVEYET